MRIRRLHILVVLVTLALCRVLHNSMPATAPAAEEARLMVAPVLPTPLTAPATTLSISDFSWISLAPPVIDAPSAPPTTQPSEPVMEWAMAPVLLPRLSARVDTITPVPTGMPTAASIPSITEIRDLGDLNFVSFGSTGTSPSRHESPPVSSEPVSHSPPPPLLVDSTPAQVGGGALPPVLLPPPPGNGSGTSPSPEPVGAGWMLLLTMFRRTSMRRIFALSSTRYVSPSSVPG
jgi:hypothetical protein